MHAQIMEKAFNDFHLPKDQVMDRVGRLSGGTKRKLSIALASIGNPDFLLLDEPSAGVDVLARSHIWESLLREKKNKAILIITHIMEESEMLANRIGFLADSQLRLNEDPTTLKSKISKTYNIHLRFKRSDITSDDTEKAVSFIRNEIDPDAKILTSANGSITVLVNIGILKGIEMNKVQWIVAVLRILEKAKADSGVTGIEEFELAQKSLMHVLFDHIDK
ncbi:hypothetical protein HK096_001521, partial [Nowakowskiella sp. JEL0078]